MSDISDKEAKCPYKKITEGKIVFDSVNFRYYKNSKEKVLDDISFTINPGETVGIIGSTGCGKTTLVSLIARLYDADSGSVSIDGTDVCDYTLKNLRGGIGMVLQKNVLFSGSIRDNLLWGDETASDGQIKEMSGYAQADGFVQSFKDGYETHLEQGGSNLSGGQKQRLCIARALLKKAKILILDDSTSAVDTATEKKIREAFRGELSDSVKIIIAQRISSVCEADKIIVMNNGRISGIGTHDELMKTNAEYKEIYDSQVSGKEAAV